MEAWRPIEGTQGRYEVSDLGNVRSTGAEFAQGGRWGGTVKRRFKPKSMAPCDNGNGYLSVHLRFDGRAERRYIHRLVLEAFVGPSPSPDHQGAHWDGNRSNNRLDNLRWATVAENRDDMARHGSKPGAAKKTHCKMGHPFEGDNLIIDSRGHNACKTCQRAHFRKYQDSATISDTRRRSLPRAVREAVSKAAGHQCQVCVAALTEYEVDHILPVYLGGGDEMSNLRALCIACHLAVTRRQAAERAKMKRIRARDGLRITKSAAKALEKSA